VPGSPVARDRPLLRHEPAPPQRGAPPLPRGGQLPGPGHHRPGGRKLDTRLETYGIVHDIKIYPGARHSFFNDQGRAHDPAASADAWERTLAFFAEHVRSEPGTLVARTP